MCVDWEGDVFIRVNVNRGQNILEEACPACRTASGVEKGKVLVSQSNLNRVVC